MNKHLHGKSPSPVGYDVFYWMEVLPIHGSLERSRRPGSTGSPLSVLFGSGNRGLAEVSSASEMVIEYKD